MGKTKKKVVYWSCLVCSYHTFEPVKGPNTQGLYIDKRFYYIWKRLGNALYVAKNLIVCERERKGKLLENIIRLNFVPKNAFLNSGGNIMDGYLKCLRENLVVGIHLKNNGRKLVKPILEDGINGIENVVFQKKKENIESNKGIKNVEVGTEKLNKKLPIITQIINPNVLVVERNI